MSMTTGSRDANYRIGVDHLRAYTAAAGHATVPRWFVADDGFTLGTWVNSRRHDHKVGRLSTAKVTELNALGMVWDPREAGYRTGLDHLRAYTATEGHATVSRRHVTDDGFTLGSWVVQRRRDRTIGRLSTERIAELNALGMVWNIHDAGYRAGVDHLRAYIAREGHATVPQEFVTDDGFGLGVWVANRRRDRRNGRLSAAKIAELTARGMVWGSSRDDNYQAGLDHLRAYTATAGHTNIPSQFVTDDGFTLGKWVANRRQDRTIGRLTPARFAELDALGMVWSPRDG